MRGKLLLLAITLLGIFLRLHNLSPFKLYPDSYQNLLVATNITTYHSVLGYLGVQGMLYPDFFMWTRPGYALLMLLINFFSNNLTLAAQLVSFTAGILAIPLAYLFINKVFKQTSYGIAGALLLALSFNHTVWSGFIMTETTGVFFLLLFLWSLFRNLQKQPDRYPNMYTGIFLGLAVITRYEYIILLLPIILLIFLTNPKPKIHLIQILFPTGLVLAITAFFLFPLQSVFGVVMTQVPDLLQTAGVLVIAFVIMLIFLVTMPKHYKEIFNHNVSKVILGTLWLFAVFIIIQMVFGSDVTFLWKDLSFVRSFVSHDLLLSFFALVGLTLLLRKKETKPLAYFTLLSLFFLGIIYHRINPDMERYLTHLVPFLLIPASFGLIKIVRTKPLLMLLIPLLLFQGWITYNGLHQEEDASWFRISYEEKAAGIVKKYLAPKTILIASLPEPYYYTLHVSTQSIFDTPPFIAINDVNATQKIMIIEDMETHAEFPAFTKFLETKLQPFKKQQFFVGENYHLTSNILKENYPVVLYELSFEELKNKLKNTQF